MFFNNKALDTPTSPWVHELETFRLLYSVLNHCAIEAMKGRAREIIKCSITMAPGLCQKSNHGRAWSFSRPQSAIYRLDIDIDEMMVLQLKQKRRRLTAPLNWYSVIMNLMPKMCLVS